jgi:serine/threonine protein kinase
MATVYLGYDQRFEREVAIKVLPAEFLHDPQFSVRFHREAKVIAALEHPAIVPVYDVGEADGLHYFVMRYMDGGSLSDILEKGEISLQEVARIINIIAPALDDAHAKGIVHRDLKPANILFDSHERPYLSDFGIAKISNAQQDVTGSAIIGTPAYMSPEQAQGKPVDGRSDIYALGAIIYRMLTGTRPYNGDTPMSMAIKHITDPTPDIRKDNPSLPPAASNFIYRAMEKDPNARFQTAVELAEALNLLASSEEASDIKTLPSFTKPALKTKIQSAPPAPSKKKNKKAWVIGGIVLLAGLLGLGLGLLNKLNTPSAATGRASSPTARVAPTATAKKPALASLASPTPPLPPTVAASPTEEEALAAPPVIGGADKVAFIANHEVWMMNIDGSELQQLTTDHAEKSKLQWLPNGKVLIYVVGKCIQTVNVEENFVDVVTCFEQAEYFDALKVSPSGEKIAISLNRELFILPFDLQSLKNARTRFDLQKMGGCFYDSESVKDVRWSDDENKIAINFLGTSGNTRIDLIRIMDISGCESGSETRPLRLDEFPAQRFTMSGYNSTSPYIPDFDWDGNELFLMNTSKRNDGYGYFYTYNTRSHKAQQLDPIGNSTCCYRDARWSPDGSYFMVAYQDIALGAETQIELYYILYGTLGSGINYTPIPMPEGFFSNLKEKPQFALRAAQ